MLYKLEKRVRRDIRLHNPFKKGEKVLVLDNKTKESCLTLYLLKRITNGLNLNIKVKKQKNLAVKQNGYAKIILPLDGDDIIENFMNHLTSKQKERQDESKNKIFFLKTILDKEVAEAVKKLGYNCKESIHELDKTEKRYPGSKFAFLKSIRFLKNIK